MVITSIQIIRTSLATLLILPLACGGNNTSTNKESAPSANELAIVTAGMSDAGSALQLASAATAFSITIDGCVSGFTGTVSHIAPSIELYKLDSGCLGKLTSFSIAGTNYNATNPNSVAFSSFANGQVATYTDSTGVKKMKVSITSQLPAILSANETVAYSFSMITQGVSQTVQKNALGDAHSLTVGGDFPPNFGIDTIAFAGVNGAGAGKFTFKLQCLAAQTGSGASTACSALKLTDTSYLLVDDTFSGGPTLSNLNAMTGFIPITTAEMTTITTNTFGGFTSLELIGPATISTHPNLILVLKNGASYEFFTINILTL